MFLGNPPSSGCHPLFLCSFLLVCISTSLRKGAEKLIFFFFLRPCMFENIPVLFSCLIKFSWTQNSRLKISPSPPLQYLEGSHSTVFKLPVLLLKNLVLSCFLMLRMQLVCLLSGRCQNHLTAPRLGDFPGRCLSEWFSPSPPHFAEHSEGLFYLETDLQFWEIFKILFPIIFSIFLSY